MLRSSTALNLARKQRGFTLFEILIATALLGIISMTLAPAFKTFLAVRENAARDTQAVNNQKVVNALLAWSENAPVGTGTVGTLPAPCANTTDKMFYGVTNIVRGCNTTLAPYLLQQGLPASGTNSDGTAAQNLRVYQRLSSLGQWAGLMYASGPQVFLAYEAAVVYSTVCTKASLCASSKTNVVPTAGVLASVTDTSGARMADPSWTPPSPVGTAAGSSYGLAYGSTLPLQKALLKTTTDHIDRIRSALKTYAAARLVEPGWGTYVSAWNAAHPGRPAVPYPTVSDEACASMTPPTSTSCSGRVAAASYYDQGCYDGWYALDEANSDILQQIGLGPSQLGGTAWGGSIEYCRDYDPSARGPGVAPHYGALRINTSVSDGLGPDGSNPSANTVISF